MQPLTSAAHMVCVTPRVSSMILIRATEIVTLNSSSLEWAWERLDGVQ